MATPQPQTIIIQTDTKVKPLEKLTTILLIGGIAFGGYFYYETFILKKDPCGSDGVFNKGGVLGSIIPFNPLCEASSVYKFFKGLVDVGVGVPVELENCPAGWTNDGLTCREPITCAEGLDFFTDGCSGGKVVGRLDSGGVCPDDHPIKIDGLCYTECPENYVRTEGMPYTCRPAGRDKDFFTSLSGGFSQSVIDLFT